MSKLTFFESPEALVEVYPEGKLVWLTWKQGANGEAFRQPALKVNEAAAKHGACYYIADARLMGLILYAETEWVERVSLPQLIAAGVKRAAVLSSPEVLNNIAVDNMVASVAHEAPFTVAYFGEPGAALQWLYKDAPLSAPLPGAVAEG